MFLLKRRPCTRNSFKKRQGKVSHAAWMASFFWWPAGNHIQNLIAVEVLGSMTAWCKWLWKTCHLGEWVIVEWEHTEDRFELWFLFSMNKFLTTTLKLIFRRHLRHSVTTSPCWSKTQKPWERSLAVWDIHPLTTPTCGNFKHYWKQERCQVLEDFSKALWA